MPVWGTLVRRAWRYAPVAVEAGRQLDRRLRPHVSAWQLARSVDGHVGSWTDEHGTHWVVFDAQGSKPLKAFPPLSDRELKRAGEQLDRSMLRHHSRLPEGQARERAERAVQRGGRVLGRGRGPDEGA